VYGDRGLAKEKWLKKRRGKKDRGIEREKHTVPDY
jgi:hypothetical protein